jgi:hypothetical protein
MAELEPGKENDRGSSALWQSVEATLARIPRIGLISIVGPFILLVAGYCLWMTYGARHLDQAKYGLKQENIVMTPQPTWIKSNVLDEVYRGSNLARLSTLDNQMSANMYNVFRVHPWIRRVFRVEKASGGVVEILVEYRDPLAMVYDDSPSPSRSGISPSPSDRASSPGSQISTTKSTALDPRPAVNFFPVDVDSVMLPVQDFSPEQIPNYFLIYAKGAVPLGRKYGDEYGDARIKEALILCRILRDDREPLGLDRIYAYHDLNGGAGAHCVLDIKTKSGKLFHWGHTPGFEVAGEPGAVAKHRKLREILTNPNSPDATAPEIDLVDKAQARLSKLFQSDSVR